RENASPFRAAASSDLRKLSACAALRKGFLPYLVPDLPSHPASPDLRAFVHLGLVDPDVVGGAVLHQAASSRDASHRWYSAGRIRRLPFGSVMHWGARFFIRHS